jgi:GxxExxY protein
MTENAASSHIVDVAYRTHSVLGPGLPESVYQAVLAKEMRKRGLTVTQQQVIPVVYEDLDIKMGFRADLVVEDRVIVEIKPIEAIAAVHKKTVAYLSPPVRKAAWPVNQLQRAIDQGRNYPPGQRPRRLARRQAKLMFFFASLCAFAIFARKALLRRRHYPAIGEIAFSREDR